MKRIVSTVIALSSIALAGTTAAHAASKGQHFFGPTGLRGSVSRNTIKVTKVDKGSPADGKITPGAVIVGAGNARFKSHVRRELAEAIDVAETEAAGGRLTLILKDGKKVDITLHVLGTYSDTAPYNCPKTEAILKRAEKFIGSNDRFHMWRLTKMALHGKAGATKHTPDPRKKSKPMFQPVEGDPLSGPPQILDNRLYCTWDWGYQLITNCEYYLLTKDESVLPAIRGMAVTLARGQDAGGLYGHQLATPERNGRLPGYAQMNQPSLSCFMGMLMARKCGVRDPDLIKGIDKTYAFYASFIGRGAFNYGVHGPNTRTFNNNGTSATGAICMALKGDKKGAKFFSQMASAAHQGLETGHASYFFNVMWTPLGAAVSGPEVTSKFFKKGRWVYTMYRAWDGRFTHNGEGNKLNAAAGYLLPYTLSRRNLVITGRDADRSLWLRGKAAADVVGMSEIDYKSLSTDELIRMSTDHFIPQVRRQASGTLVSRRDELLPRWISMLREGTSEEKGLAISQYGWWIPLDKRLPQVDDIGAILRDTTVDLDVRVAAAGSLCHMGKPAHKYYMDIVRLAAQDRPEDRFGDIDWALGGNINKLCPTPFKDGLVADKALLYQSALKLIRNRRQHARAEGLRMVAEIPLEDFHIVADEVMHIIEDKDPTYHSYHNPGGPVGAAITILANLNIKEGIPLAMAIELNPSGKFSFKAKATWAALAKYGGNAKEALAEYIKRHKGRTNWGRHNGAFNAMVKAIEGDKNPKRLLTFEEAKRVGKRR